MPTINIPDGKIVLRSHPFTLDAMKMETTIYAEQPGRVAEVLVQPGRQVEAGELLLRFE